MNAKMKRKLTAIGLAASMGTIAVIGGTLAYFTDSEQATNVFTVGNIDIELDEVTAVLDKKGGNELPGKLIESESGASYRNIMPTNYLQKKVTITNKENPAYVRVVVMLNNHLETYMALENAIDSDKTMTDDQKVAAKNDLYAEVFDNWGITFTNTEACGSIILDTHNGAEQVDTTITINNYHLFDKENYFTSGAEYASHDEVLEAGEGGFAAGYYAPMMNPYERCYVYYLHMDRGESITLFDGLNCPANFTQEQAKMFDGLKIEVYADAIQAEGFADAKSAYNALEKDHPLTSMRVIEGTQITTTEDFTDAVNGEGGTVVLKAPVKWETGAGIGSTPFAAAADITLIGDGTEATAFTATGSGVGPIGSDTNTVTFKNMIIHDESVSYAENNWEYTYLEFRGKLVFENCTFTSGIMLEGDADATFINCSFDSPNASEYSVWVSDGKASFTNCTFTGTRGLKMHEQYGTDVESVTIDRCTFLNLTKKPGIAIGTMNADTTVSITNSTFTNCQPGDQSKYMYETDTDLSTITFTETNNTVN